MMRVVFLRLGEFEERKTLVLAVGDFQGRVVRERTDVNRPNYLPVTGGGSPLAAQIAKSSIETLGGEVKSEPGGLLRG